DGAARGEADDDLDRTCGIIIRRSGDRQARERRRTRRQMQEFSAEKFHNYALDARRQRIIISQSEVNWVKWLCLGLQAVCALLAIAMVHSDDRLTSAITLSLFGVGVAASLLLILAHDRPFTGELAVSPNPLLQVMPALGAS